MPTHSIFPVIQNVCARKGQSLSGRWRTIVDPYQAGYKNIYGEPWRAGWFREFPVRPGLAEYDFERSDLLSVPGDWNSQSDRLFFYEGTVWYKRTFAAKAAPGQRVLVHFGAANYQSRVYLNGEEIGAHEGGFTPFAIEITDQITVGDNALVVQVDNTRRADGVPGTQTDWWNYGGLTRDVRIVEVPEVFIRDYSFRLGDSWQIEGWVQLDARDSEAAGNQPVRVRIPALDVDREVSTDSSGRAVLDLAVRPELWSPAKPKRYEVQISSAEDAVSDAIGFRRIEVRGCEILLNGSPIFLRGISIHEEAPNREGRAAGEDDARALLAWARELGCNFVRLAHYTHDESMLRVADEMGLLVWGEVPVYWNLDWENSDTLDNARHQLSSMLERDRNRAAFVLCSIGNEAPGTPERLAFMSQLAKHVKEVDASRLVTCALMAANQDGEMLIEDAMGEYLDVMGCNEYLGWYYGDVDSLPDTRWRSAYQKPLIMSELGAGALAGHVGSPGEIFSEDHQAAVYRGQIAMLKQIPFLAGLSPWILKDFRSPRRVLPDVQDYYNRKGLISERGQRKRAFGVLQGLVPRVGGVRMSRRSRSEHGRGPFAVVLAIITLASVFSFSAAQGGDAIDLIVLAVSASQRPAADVARDADRRPADVLRFFEVTQGQRVAELMAGSGYYSEILGHAPRLRWQGLGTEQPLCGEKRFADRPLRERLARLGRLGLENLVRLDTELEAPKLPGNLDLAIMILFYHDTYWQKVDRSAMNRAIFEALRPGGIYGVIDHHAEAGSGARDVETIHRVDAALVRKEIEAAGFVLEAESDLLRHPEDARTKNVFDKSIRGKTDRFIYRFRKPAR